MTISIDFNTACVLIMGMFIALLAFIVWKGWKE